MTWLMTLDASTRHLDLPLARIALPFDGFFSIRQLASRMGTLLSKDPTLMCHLSTNEGADPANQAGEARRHEIHHQDQEHAINCPRRRL